MSMLALFSKPPTYAGGPIIDGQVVTRNPQEAFIRGEAAKVPLIIGTTSQDLAALFPPDRTKPLEYFGPEAEKARSIYDPNGNAPVPALLAAIAVDMTMHEPARFVAKQMTVRGNPVWLYRFDYVAESLRPKVTGAEHGSELPYMFNTLDTRYGKDATEKDRAMGRAFHSYFANFVKGGDPNGQGLPNWSKYDSAKSDIMQLTMDNGAVMEADPWKERLDLVEHVADTQTTTQSETARPSLLVVNGRRWHIRV